MAFEAFYSNRKRPKKINLDPFKVEFEERSESVDGKKKAPPMTPEQATAISKARWGAIRGGAGPVGA